MVCCSLNGKWQAALHIGHRLGQRQLTVHVFNALLVACQLGGRWQEAAALEEQLRALRITPNQVGLAVSGNNPEYALLHAVFECRSCAAANEQQRHFLCMSPSVVRIFAVQAARPAVHRKSSLTEKVCYSQACLLVQVTADLLVACDSQQPLDLVEASGLLHQLVLSSAASRR